MANSLVRPAIGEGVGVAALSLAVIGGGELAARAGASGGEAALLGVAAIAATVGVLLVALGPLSGAHINPAISFSLLVSGHIDRRRFAAYAAAQTLGGVLGALLGNWLWSAEVVALGGGGLTGRNAVCELIAVAGLIALIHACVRGGQLDRLAQAVPVYVLAVGLAAPFWVLNPALVAGLALGRGAWGAPAALALVALELTAAGAAAWCVGRIYAAPAAPASAESAATPDTETDTETAADTAADRVPALPAQQVFEVVLEGSGPERVAVAQLTLGVAQRLLRPVDLALADRAGRVLLAVEGADESVLSALERRLGEHVTLALLAAGLPHAAIELRPVDPAELAARR